RVLLGRVDGLGLLEVFCTFIFIFIFIEAIAQPSGLAIEPFERNDSLRVEILRTKSACRRRHREDEERRGDRAAVESQATEGRQVSGRAPSTGDHDAPPIRAALMRKSSSRSQPS